ncbi:MAG: sugar dehydrogenase complex small subunit [Bradyrhizobium sp.]
MTDLSRRKMLTGAAVAAAAGAVGAPQLATPAAADDASDLETFVNMSVGITGIARSRLAPAVDPVEVKREYFAVAKQDPAFSKLIAAVGSESNPDKAAAIVMNNSDPAIKYLGRAILLAWYTGCWYTPDKLRLYNSPQAPATLPTPDKVISGTAYTQGWNWRVGQTHPMGYSEWLFGYWHANPPPLNQFTGNG